MEIFLDTANVGKIGEWISSGVVDGVTTNPGLMLQEKVYDIETMAKEISALVFPCPVSVEVTTNNLNEMLAQARMFASWAPNIVIKIPQLTQDGIPCYGVMKQLANEGIRVNATVVFSFGQVILSAKAQATYISLFAGRIADEGGDSSEIIQTSVAWLEHWGYNSKILVGSIRTVGDILNAAKAGAHIITIPPQFITKMSDHKFTRETVKEFTIKANKALDAMAQDKKHTVECSGSQWQPALWSKQEMGG